MKLTLTDILNLNRDYRRNLINMISGARSVNLIGTVSKDGDTNLAVFNSITHLGANPPLLGMISRPTSVERHTYSNTVATGVFTINSAPSSMLDQVHQTSAKYESGVSEFDTCGFTPYYIGDFAAPFVKESPIQIGLSLQEDILLKSNNTRLLVGKVELLIIDESLLDDLGFLDVNSANLLSVCGLNTYFKPMFYKHLPYAKPK